MCFNTWDPYKTEKVKIAPGWMRRGLPQGWIWVNSEKGFNFYAPPGTRYIRQKGIDWEAGEFDGPDFQFRFYLGRYPQDPHDLKHEADYSQQQLTVDGRSAFFQQMTFGGDDTRDAPYFAELFVRKAIVADVQSKDWLALDLYGRAKTPVARETMKKVFMTMRFDDP